MRALAIDPGYERLGIAVIEKLGKDKETLVHSECFKTAAGLPFHERLRLLGNRVAEVIETHAPEALAIETLFFSANKTTALKVAEARGVIMYEAARKGLRIFEYGPADIKIAVTGHGKSDKTQVTAMIPKLIRMETSKRHDDEYDAIACGLTFFAIDGRNFQTKKPL